MENNELAEKFTNSSSIVQITSSISGNNVFGTGFIFYNEDNLAYVLTCAHVLEDIFEENSMKAKDLLVDGKSASVESAGTGNGLDLAVVKVSEIDNECLNLKESSQTGSSVIIVGFHKYGKHRRKGILKGKLGNRFLLQDNIATLSMSAWDIEFEKENSLDSGYSGSPVIEVETEKVVGVLSYQSGTDKASAISIDTVGKVWLDMPSVVRDIIGLSLLNERNDVYLRQLQNKMKDIYNEIQDLLKKETEKEKRLAELKNKDRALQNALGAAQNALANYREIRDEFNDLVTNVLMEKNREETEKITEELEKLRDEISKAKIEKDLVQQDIDYNYKKSLWNKEINHIENNQEKGKQMYEVASMIHELITRPGEITTNSDLRSRMGQDIVDYLENAKKHEFTEPQVDELLNLYE
jgi:hypothetical protein